MTRRLTSLAFGLLASTALSQDLPLTVGPDGTLRRTDFFQKNQALLGQTAVLSTNGFANGVLTAEDIITSRVTTDAAVLNYDGFTQPPNYAAPISMVKLLTPAVAENLEDLLAADTGGISRWAYVLSGAGSGQWLYCPDETSADNGRDIRRPEEVVSDSSPGRWAKMSAGSGLGPKGPPGAPGPVGPPGPPGDSEAMNIAQALGSTTRAFSLGASFASARSTVSLEDGRGQFVALWLPQRATLTGVGFVPTTAGDFVGDAFNGVAVYRFANGTQTLVAQSANDDRIWKNNSATYVKVPFTSPTVLAPGLYFVWALYNSSSETTAPAISAAGSISALGAVTLDFANQAKVSGFVPGLAAFPPTATMATATALSALPVFSLY